MLHRLAWSSLGQCRLGIARQRSLDVGLLGVASAGIALALRGSVALGIASCRLALHRLGFVRYRLAPHCPAWHRAVWHHPGFGWHCEVLLGIVSLGIALRGAS